MDRNTAVLLRRAAILVGAAAIGAVALAVQYLFIQFEVLFVATWGIPLILAAWLGREFRRSGRRSIWSAADHDAEE